MREPSPETDPDETWRAVGFESAEEAQAWLAALADRHPNRGRIGPKGKPSSALQQAFWECVRRGNFRRRHFERWYARETIEWYERKRRGVAATNLIEIFNSEHFLGLPEAQARDPDPPAVTEADIQAWRQTLADPAAGEEEKALAREFLEQTTEAEEAR